MLLNRFQLRSSSLLLLLLLLLQKQLLTLPHLLLMLLLRRGERCRLEEVSDAQLTPRGSSSPVGCCCCCMLLFLLHTKLARCSTAQVHGIDSS